MPPIATVSETLSTTEQDQPSDPSGELQHLAEEESKHLAEEESKHLARQELKHLAQEELYQRLGPQTYDADLGVHELEELVIGEIDLVLERMEVELAVELTTLEHNQLVVSIRDDVLGLGPIQSLIEDQGITEIMVNSHDLIYVERQGRLEKISARFSSEQHLRQIIDRIVGPIGRRIDESSPMVDGRLADGSRVNAIIPPLAVHGSSITIRKFPEQALRVEDLIRSGSLTREAAGFLEACVVGGLNMIVSGGTGTGKTTMLNVLSSFIPSSDRVVTIEDSVELQLAHENLVALEARPANVEGSGLVSIRDLVKNALRMRPDRIVVGECRGSEALDMLQAMNTGHEGSLTTAHANSSRDLLARLETMVLMAELDLPARAIRDQIASAVQIVVHLHRLQDGRRAVTSISEITGIEDERILLQDVYLFDWNAEPVQEGLGVGRLVPTGVRPKHEARLAERGVPILIDWFELERATVAVRLRDWASQPTGESPPPEPDPPNVGIGPDLAPEIPDVPAIDGPSTDVPAIDGPSTDVPAINGPSTDDPAPDPEATDVPSPDVLESEDQVTDFLEGGFGT